MKTYEKIYSAVRKIPKGRVATYGQIGQMLDLTPRVVGWALNRLVSVKNTRYTVPWQRVVNCKGSISTNRAPNIPLDLQKHLLKNEGIKFNACEKINLKKYSWKLK